MNKLIHFFIRRTLLVNLIIVLVLGIGYIRLKNTPKESYPHVERKILWITTIYPGAAPEEVEINVTIPIEDAIKGVDGVKEYSSQSFENVSRVHVILDDEIKDVEKVKNDIRRSIDSVDLPKEVNKKPTIWEWKISTFPVMEIGVFSEKLSYSALRTRVKDLKKKLQEISYISKVEFKGMKDKEIRIELDLNQLEKHYISIQEIIQTIQANNISVTGGVFEENNINTILTVFSKLKNVEDVGNIILRSTFEGKRIFLKDIAVISDTFKDEDFKVRFNGKNGISLLPHKKEAADIITTTDKIKEVVKNYQQSIKDENVDIIYLWDMSLETRTRLNIVQNNAIIGLMLVVSILFIFMNFQNAFWTAMGIPFSIAFAMIFFPFFNITINSVSLIGIIIVMGMVVDDAIIISENIFRHKLMKKSWDQAAYEGTMEVSAPVVATVLTTIVAFIPLSTLKGIIGDFTKEIPFIVMFILLGSIIEALFILPNHIAHGFHIKREEKEVKEKKFVLFLKEQYIKILKPLLKYRYWVLLIFILLFLLSYYVLFSGHAIKYIDFPAEDSTAIYLYGKVKTGQTLAYTSEKIKLIEHALDKYPKQIIISYGTDIGEPGYPENFSLVINLTPPSQRKMKANTIISNLRSIIENNKNFTNIVFVKESGGPPVGKAIELKIIGNNNEKRKELTEEIYSYIQKIPGVKDLIRTDQDEKKEYKILVDHAQASKLGISPMVIGQTIRAAFHGVVATELQTPDELIEYKVMLEEKYQKKLNTLYKLLVPNHLNTLIPLSRIIKIKTGKIINRIEHYNGDRMTSIEADLDKTKITPKEVAENIKKDYSRFELDNPGFRLIFGGEIKQSSETIQSMIDAAFMAILLIFFILILNFRSLSQSLMVLLTIPFSFIGIAMALLIHNSVLSTMALFGMVGLGGVVVNDAIVMVEYINNLKKKNLKKSLKEIITLGAETRLRPILLTSLTTVAGLLPTTYGFGGSDQMIMPTTLVMAWGLFFSMEITLLLIPVLYHINEDIHKIFKNLFQKIISRMNQKRAVSIFIFLIGCLIKPFSGYMETLPLNEFIQQSIKNNPEIFSELKKIEQADAQQIQAKAIYDIYLKAYYYRIQDSPFSEYSSVPIDKQYTDQIGVQLQSKIPYLGTRVSGGIDFYKNRLDLVPSPIFNYPSPVTYFNPEINLNVSQPLLKNWFGLLDKFPLDQAQLNKLITEESVKETIENIIIDLYHLYFDWYLLYHQEQIYSTNVKNSEILLDQINKKYKESLVEKGDVSKIQIMYWEYKKAQEIYQTQYKTLSRKIFQWRTGLQDISVELNDIPEQELNFSFAVPLHYAISNTRQMKILDLTKSLLKTTLSKEKNEKLPELDFIFSYTTRNYTFEKSKIFNNFDYNQFTVGLSLSYPLGQSLGKGKVKEAETLLKKWDEDLKIFERSYAYHYHELLNGIKLYEKVLDYNKKLIEQAQIQLQSEEKKYNQGRSDLYFIVQNRNSLLQYRLATVQDYLMLRKLQLEWSGLCDQVK